MADLLQNAYQLILFPENVFGTICEVLLQKSQKNYKFGKIRKLDGEYFLPKKTLSSF